MSSEKMHDLIRRRWSPVQFLDRPVAGDKLAAAFEAARWAASSFGEQPWRFIVGVKGESGTLGLTWEKVLAALAEANQAWARHAPVLGLSVAKMKFQRNGKPNRHAWHDVGLAMSQLTLQATAMDLFVHQMGGFNSSQARAAFGIPEDAEPVAAFAMGYHGANPQLADELRKRDQGPRQRRPLSELVFAGQWDQPADLAV